MGPPTVPRPPARAQRQERPASGPPLGRIAGAVLDVHRCRHVLHGVPAVVFDAYADQLGAAARDALAAAGVDLADPTAARAVLAVATVAASSAHTAGQSGRFGAGVAAYIEAVWAAAVTAASYHQESQR